MVKPLVSIITPAFNASQHIEHTLESVLAQSYANWELLIVVDKNSKDDTDLIAKTFASRDPRIRVLPTPAVNGVAANRNAAIEASRGEFIAFLDADDLWHYRKLESQLNFMLEKNVDFSFTGYNLINHKGERLNCTFRAPERLSYSDLLKHVHPIGCLTVMVRKAKFKNLQFKQKGSEDFLLWLQLLKQTPYIYGVPEVLGSYRVLMRSRSRNKWKAAKYRWHTLRDCEQISVPKAVFYFSHYTANSMVRLFKGRFNRLNGVIISVFLVTPQTTTKS